MLYGVRQAGLSKILRRYIVESVTRGCMGEMRDPFSVVPDLKILIGSLCTVSLLSRVIVYFEVNMRWLDRC